MEKYKMLLGTPVKCYYKNSKGGYDYMQTGYYVGNGYCVGSFTDVFDGLNNGIRPYLLKFDNYIPLELLNKNYGGFTTAFFPHKRNIMDRNFFKDMTHKREEFDVENIEDFYTGHLDEFWWWHEIQIEIQNIK
jgi:hypothetical protein